MLNLLCAAPCLIPLLILAILHATAAFVEYESERASAIAKQALHGYALLGQEISVTFAKR